MIACLVYKCRMCGDRIDHKTEAPIEGMSYLLYCISGSDPEIPVTLTIVHKCSSTKRGLADLIGAHEVSQ